MLEMFTRNTNMVKRFNRKKIAQATRRQVSEAVAEYQKGLVDKLDAIRLVFRPKPKFVPWVLWRFLTNLVVDLSQNENTTKRTSGGDTP